MIKVWTFAISHPLGGTELQQLQEAGTTFVDSWTAHSHQLSGSFEILHKRLIVVKVDEDVNAASGCSIDKLTRFMKLTEGRFGVELLNRLNVPYRAGDAVNVVPHTAVPEMLATGALNEDTVVFDTAVANEEELRNWEKPLRETWLRKYLSKTV